MINTQAERLILLSPEQLFKSLHQSQDRQAIRDGDDAEYRAYLNFYNLDMQKLYPAVKHKLSVFEAAGERLVAQSFKSGANSPELVNSPEPINILGIAIIVHGYYDHVGLYGHLIRYCLEQNLDVYCFDLPGHGLSTGPRASIDSFQNYQTALDEFIAQICPAQAQQRCLFGQSMGGAIIMDHLLSNFAGQNTSPYTKVALFAPLVRPAAWPINKWVFALLRHFTREQKRSFAKNSHDVDFLEFVKNDPLQASVLPIAWVAAMADWVVRFVDLAPCELEVLVLQGTHDSTVDWKYDLGIIREKFAPKILSLDAARHHLVNESEPYRQKMFDFITSN